MGILLGLFYLACVSCSYIVIVEAFRDEIWKGFVAIIFPFYLWYYAFAEFEHDQKSLIIAGMLTAPVLHVMVHMCQF